MEHLFSAIGISFLMAPVLGAMAGIYLASVYEFKRVRNLRRPVINNIVITLSFFVPIFIQRLLTEGPIAHEVSQRWAAAAILYLIFAMTADVVNYFVSGYVSRRRSR